MILEERILARLEERKITYERFEHPPVYTVEEAKKHVGHVPGQPLKNLFLVDGSKKNHLLVVARAEETISLVELGDQLGLKHLRFASSHRLDRVLGVAPGAVSPLALLREEAKGTLLAMTNGVDFRKPLTFHPGRCDVTLVIKGEGFLRYLEDLSIAFVRLPDKKQ